MQCPECGESAKLCRWCGLCEECCFCCGEHGDFDADERGIDPEEEECRS